MRPYIILVIIGVIVAGLAAVAVRSTVSTPVELAEAPPVTTTRVLIAQDTITAGTFIRADKDLTWGEWPEDKIQSPPYIIDDSLNMQDYNGAVVRRTIYAGEPITLGAMVKPGEGGFMSAVLQSGFRAISLPVNATPGNAGFIFPGDRVALILPHAIQNAVGQNFASETFVKDVRVLAVDQMLDNPENKALLAKTVTLEVSPRQAEAISVALEMGKISLALRSLANDVQIADSVDPLPVIAPENLPDASGQSIDFFYPDETVSTPQNQAYTRDSDVSNLLSGSQQFTRQPTRVRVIRGDETTELEFRQTGQ
ncbi:MAG: Flp pilus assembly protein CpaB [Alphaproteobacteria bacterium]|nr:Flp pilus assembly protein CpaB [Alphaproteobacteria bacterium]